jgi:RNA polymerase sigma-70 factor (ECF subfamily)
MGKVASDSVDETALPPDGELARRAAAGDREAFDLLIRRYQRQAVAVAYRLLGNPQDALEVTQDAFIKAFTGIKTLQKPEAFGGWLMRIVSNLSLNYRRSRKSRSAMPLDDLIEDGDPHGQAPTDPGHLLQSREMGRRLQRAMAQLPEKQRVAITLFTVEGLSQKQAADALDCSVEAVKWHVFQARKKLKELLKDYL